MTTDSDFTPTAWHNLRAGDVIVCPVTHRAERIIRNEARPRAHRFVRTNHHDHTPHSMASVRAYRPPALRRAFGTSPIRVGGYT